MPFSFPEEGPISRADCCSLDTLDPLASFRDAFVLPEGVIYLDGMSLGALPKAASEQVTRVVDEEWGHGLVRSWNTAGWIDAPTRLGGQLAPLIGASADEVVVADSTSVNLFKLLVAALRLRSDRKVILTEAGNFPTDIYVAQGVQQLFADVEVRLVTADDLGGAIDRNVAVVSLTHVDFKSGRRHDMAEVTRRAHDAGALMLWDLSHSAGAFPVELTGCDVDLVPGRCYPSAAPAFHLAAVRSITDANGE